MGFCDWVSAEYYDPYSNAFYTSLTRGAVPSVLSSLRSTDHQEY
jgi:hypothetical protein